MPQIAAPDRTPRIRTHETRRNRLGTALLIASLALAACTSRTSHNTEPTAPAPTGTHSTAKPTTGPQTPGFTANPKHDSKHLLQCLAGNFKLPKGTANADDLSLDINKQGTLTNKTLSATGRKALQAATVEVHDEIGGGSRVLGSGVIVDGMIFTAAHVVEDRTIDHITFLLNGEKYQKMGMHKIQGGCYIYQHNGKQAKLDLHSLDPQYTVTDDVAVLIPDRPIGPGLQLGAALPTRSEVLYSAGHKYRPDQHDQADWELISAIALQPRSSDGGNAIALTSGKKPDNFDAGDSGSPLVDADAALIGIGNSSIERSAMFLGINYGVSSETPLQEVDYTSLDVLKAAAQTVGR